MADFDTITIQEVRKKIAWAIVELEAINIEPPASLYLAVLLLHHAVDQDESDASL